MERRVVGGLRACARALAKPVAALAAVCLLCRAAGVVQGLVVLALGACLVDAIRTEVVARVSAYDVSAIPFVRCVCVCVQYGVRACVRMPPVY